jgi:hypothetical protein
MASVNKSTRSSGAGAAKTAPVSVGYSGTPLWKKLGVRDDQVTWRLKMPASVVEEIARGAAEPKFVTAPEAGLDMAHLFVTKKKELGRELARLRGLLAQDGVVWVSWPKKASGGDGYH